MIDPNLTKKVCVNCSFAPFCMADINGQPCAGHIKQLVAARRQLERNDVLCLPKNKFQSLYAIEKGALKAYKVDASGREHIHGFYFAGEVIGYKAIHMGHYLSTVVALTETVVCEVPYDQFLELLKLKPELYRHMLELISKQLNAGAYVDAASAEQRIAAFLIDVSQRIRDARPMVELTLPMSRQDIGNYLGLTAETVSRVFSRLQHDNVISINRKLIHINNPAKLKQIAE